MTKSAHTIRSTVPPTIRKRKTLRYQRTPVFASLAKLTDLPLGCCREITDAGLLHLGLLPSLTALKLYKSEKITDAGLAQP